MPNNFQYNLQFAGVPFITDAAVSVRMASPSYPPEQDENLTPIRDQQRLLDLIDCIDRNMSFDWLQDFEYETGAGGRRTNALASWSQAIQDPIHINSWYYPNSASRWSLFRALATEKMYQAMLNNSNQQNQADLVMQCVPIGPNNPNPEAAPDGVTTEMFLFLGRPIAKTLTQYDGLYLLTFVDERYFFQGTPAPELEINQNTTWQSIINTCTNALDISFTMPTIPTAYGQPEPDSQLWTQWEQASTLLDAIALNLGMVIVRNFDGTYTMVNPLQSKSIVESNRGNANTVVRLMGGNIFSDTNQIVRQSVVPSYIHVAFPTYALTPVPHFVNFRYAPQRPSAWYEDGYGDAYTISVPIASGPPLVSGLVGVSDMTVWNTAKALQSGESDTSPFNMSGLNALAAQISTDIWNYKVAAALDETYPGIVDWNPDGLHDIVWTYSSKKRIASTRVLRGSWNNDVRDMQHATPGLSGFTNTPVGVGGPSVAQTWRDSYSGSPSTTLAGSVNSTSQMNAQFTSLDYFPTQNRWRGIINSGQADQEICLFEGTSGGTTVNIVYRGIDGTLPQVHTNGAIIQQITPNVAYAPNLITAEKGQFIYQGIWTSGGISETVIVPQIQTVQCFTAAGISMGGDTLYSGQVNLYSGGYLPLEYVWLSERNDKTPVSGKYYEGQLLKTSAASGSTPAPIYGISEQTQTQVVSGTLTSGYAAGYFSSGHFPSGTIATILSGTIGITDIGSGGVVSGAVGNGAVVSGSIASGQVGQYHLSSGALNSGQAGNNSIVSGSIASGQIGWPHIFSGTFIGVSGVVVEYEPGYVTPKAIVISASGAIYNPYTKTTSYDYTSGIVKRTNYQIPTNAQAVYFSGQGALTIDGMVLSGGAQPAEGQRIYIFNANSGDIDVTTGTSGYGRVITPDNFDINLLPAEGLWFEYSRKTNSGVGSWQAESYLPIQSGQIFSGLLANGAVVSGSIASGSVGQYHLSSGAVNSGQIGNAAVVSGSIASGSVGWPHISSGTIVGVSGIVVEYEPGYKNNAIVVSVSGITGGGGGGSDHSCQVNTASTSTFNPGDITDIVWNNYNFDTDGYGISGTASLRNPNSGLNGKYYIYGAVEVTTGFVTANKGIRVSLMKNSGRIASETPYVYNTGGTSYYYSASLASEVQLVSGDLVALRVENNSGAGTGFLNIPYTFGIQKIDHGG